MKNKRPLKCPDLMKAIRICLEKGRYFDTRHALERQNQRKITRPEILYILRHGYHEKRKDQYDEKFLTWNYAIRGKTPDHRSLRVIVSLERNNILIITAIILEG